MTHFDKLKAALPPFVYSLAFWQALAYVIAALTAAFTSYKLEAGILLTLTLAVLKMFDIAPQIREAKLRLELMKRAKTHTKPE